MRSAHQQRGFTLIEVVVAFAIFVLSLGALYESLEGGVRRSLQSSARVHALLVAQSLIAERRIRIGPWPAIEIGRGDDGSSWQIEATPLQAPLKKPLAWRLYQLRVVVHANDSDVHGVELRSLEMAESPS